MSMFDDDVTYDDENLPDHFGETYRGHEGVLRAVERWIAPFESMTIELLEIVETERRLLSIHRWRAKAQHTGIEFDTPLAYVWTFRDGKIVHFRSFLDIADAREAMRLTEQAMSKENVERAKRGVAALNAPELPDELAEELLASDYRIENVSTAVTDKTYYGIDGVRQWRADFFEMLDENARYETEEILADGDDFVIARCESSVTVLVRVRQSSCAGSASAGFATARWRERSATRGVGKLSKPWGCRGRRHRRLAGKNRQARPARFELATSRSGGQPNRSRQALQMQISPANGALPPTR